MFTLQSLIDMCNHWHHWRNMSVLGFFFSGIIFFLIIKVGHTKIFFSVALTQRPVNEVLWEFFFSFSLNRFAKCNSRVRGNCCRVYWRGTSISDVILQRKEKNKRRTAHFVTPVSSEFGAAVCVTLYRNELFHAGSATVM